MLQRIYKSEGGTELCDTLMKYLYKGMAQAPSSTQSSGRASTPQQSGFSQIGSRVGAGEGQGHAMSVLLSWHEKVSQTVLSAIELLLTRSQLVEIVGPGSIVRVMSDRRTV